MALIFVRPETPSGSFNWDDWYQKNKKRLSEKKKARYQNDPAYRKAALERSRAQRQKKVVSPDEGYTISFSEMARLLHITPWVLREWRRKNYFPEPQHRDHRLWFRPDQFVLLNQLATFFSTYGVRVGENKRQALEAITEMIYANW